MRMGTLIPPGRYARKMARPLRFLLRHSTNEPIDVTILGGQQMRLHPKGNSCEMRMLVLPHLFDRYEFRILSRMLHPGCVFIDGGANVGIYCIYVALRAGSDARIIAVEPHPLALERLRCNILINRLTTVTVEPVALNDYSGRVALNTNCRNIGNSSIVAKQNGAIIEVPGCSLMDIASKYGLTRIDALKLDVEGAEDRVLLPFFNSAPVQLWPRLLLVENGETHWKDDCRSMILEKGYQQKGIRSRNMVFWRRAPS